MIRWIVRRLRISLLRAELRDIDKVEQQAKDTIAHAWRVRMLKQRELEEALNA